VKAKVSFTGVVIATTVGHVALIYSETQSAFQVALVILILLAEISVAAVALLSFKAGESAWCERAMAASALAISVGAILLVSLFAYGLAQYEARM
jgi:hypothetical protein